MAQPRDKHGEAMFIIIIRTPQAKNLFTAWINSNKNARARKALQEMSKGIKERRKEITAEKEAMTTAK